MFFFENPVIGDDFVRIQETTVVSYMRLSYSTWWIKIYDTVSVMNQGGETGGRREDEPRIC